MPWGMQYMAAQVTNLDNIAIFEHCANTVNPVTV